MNKTEIAAQDFISAVQVVADSFVAAAQKGVALLVALNANDPPTETTALSDDISVLELSARSRNALKNNEIHTIGDLVTKTKRYLSGVPNLGKGSISEIEHALAGRGMELLSIPRILDSNRL